jgi:hypothetical protein
MDVPQIWSLDNRFKEDTGDDLVNLLRRVCRSSALATSHVPVVKEPG